MKLTKISVIAKIWQKVIRNQLNNINLNISHFLFLILLVYFNCFNKPKKPNNPFTAYDAIS